MAIFLIIAELPSVAILPQPPLSRALLKPRALQLRAMAGSDSVPGAETFQDVWARDIYPTIKDDYEALLHELPVRVKTAEERRTQKKQNNDEKKKHNKMREGESTVD